MEEIPEALRELLERIQADPESATEEEWDTAERFLQRQKRLIQERQERNRRWKEDIHGKKGSD